VGVPHEKWGERPMALIVLKSHYEGSVTGNDLRDFMLRLVGEGLVSKWAVPDTFQLVQEIPKTSVGKINKKLIREQWAPDRP